MESLGSHFKKKREEEGYSIDDVAEETNIASRYIRAIEEQEFSQFPADVYAKGFIRTYAKFLDLDAQSLVTEYSLNFEDNETYDEEESSSRKVVYWITLVVVVLLALFLLLLRFAWLPSNQMVVRPRDTQTQRQSLETSSSDQKKMEVEEKSDRLKLRVVASRKTWVYAIFDGMRKQEFMFQPGDELTWEAEDTVRLRLGNAGGLELYYNGNRLPKLGESGEVADRIITLENGKIKIKSPR